MLVLPIGRSEALQMLANHLTKNLPRSSFACSGADLDGPWRGVPDQRMNHRYLGSFLSSRPCRPANWPTELDPTETQQSLNQVGASVTHNTPRRDAAMWRPMGPEPAPTLTRRLGERLSYSGRTARDNSGIRQPSMRAISASPGQGREEKKRRLRLPHGRKG
jgi:hypothetical protein